MKIAVLSMIVLAFAMSVAARRTATLGFFRRIIVLLFITSLVETVEVFYLKKFGLSGTVLYNLFSIFEMLIWASFFYKLLAGNRTNRWIVMILTALFMGYTIIELCGPHGLKRFHVNSYRLYGVSIICFSVIYLSNIMRNDEIFHPLQDMVFWICAACIIFQSGFFVHTTVVNMDAFRTDRGSLLTFRLLLQILNIIYYSLLCIGFYTSFRTRYNSRHRFSKT